MKDFVEIQYSVLCKLCFGQSYFRQVDTIIGLGENSFQTNSLFLLVDNWFSG